MESCNARIESAGQKALMRGLTKFSSEYLTDCEESFRAVGQFEAVPGEGGNLGEGQVYDCAAGE